MDRNESLTESTGTLALANRSVEFASLSLPA